MKFKLLKDQVILAGTIFDTNVDDDLVFSVGKIAANIQRVGDWHWCVSLPAEECKQSDIYEVIED